MAHRAGGDVRTIKSTIAMGNGTPRVGSPNMQWVMVYHMWFDTNGGLRPWLIPEKTTNALAK